MEWHTLVRVLVLDTSAFIMGFDVIEVESYTVPHVRDELKRGEYNKLRFDNAVRNGWLKVVSPEPGYVDEVRSAIAEMGEVGVLSESDSQLLALGLQLRAEGLEPVIVSDDYSVQNVSSKLGMSFRSLATSGIKREFEWVVYCPGCRKTYTEPQPGGICPICGTELKRKPRKKRPIMK
jgi:UPF0271 protein